MGTGSALEAPKVLVPSGRVVCVTVPRITYDLSEAPKPLRSTAGTLRGSQRHRPSFEGRSHFPGFSRGCLDAWEEAGKLFRFVLGESAGLFHLLFCKPRGDRRGPERALMGWRELPEQAGPGAVRPNQSSQASKTHSTSIGPRAHCPIFKRK